MRGHTCEPTEASSLVDAALRLQKVATEPEVFAVLHMAFQVIAGPVGVEGWALGPSGQTAHRAARMGTPSGEVAEAEIEAWLLGGLRPVAFATRASAASVVLSRRLKSGGNVVGGLIVTGPKLRPGVRRRLDELALLGAGALAELRGRRLCRMVLEALEQSEEAISFYDETAARESDRGGRTSPSKLRSARVIVLDLPVEGLDDGDEERWHSGPEFGSGTSPIELDPVGGAGFSESLICPMKAALQHVVSPPPSSRSAASG